MENNLAKGTHIRTLDMQSDLSVIADLIEDSFSLYNDVDGQAFLRQMRQSAKFTNIFGILPNWSESFPKTPAGFVWDEGGQIVGNVNIIPFTHHGQKIFLIANVAVRPDHRRKGIARALTRHALNFLSGKGVWQIWLQVNQLNQGAVDLYHQLEFEDQCCRSSWHLLPGNKLGSDQDLFENALLRRRDPREWQFQKLWLDKIYPDEIIWHFPVRLQDFSPDSFWEPDRWFEILKLRHWALSVDDNPIGFLTWQKTESFADSLWLAPDHRLDEIVTIVSMLQAIPERVGRNRPLAVDYPCGRGVEALQSAGFSFVRSLIWMKFAGK
ncbi:MAG: GNAT family N-acetyltransferase [Dehalococcoidia bacterium]|nr:GNAT family N-acetyltransferase [Dehalococcoidia bacterium]